MTYSYQYARRHGYVSNVSNPFKYRYKLTPKGSFVIETKECRLDGARYWKNLNGDVVYSPGREGTPFDIVSLQSRYEEIMRVTREHAFRSAFPDYIFYGDLNI